MSNYEVDVRFTDLVYDKIMIEADDADQAEFDAKNMIFDLNPNAGDIEILEVTKLG
jgi:hypothetical protein